MMLTWKDAVSALFMAAIVAVYLAFLGGTHLWLISGARGATAAVLVLGMTGGCALGAAGTRFGAAEPVAVRIYLTFVSLLVIVALATAVAGLVTGSTIALAALVLLTVSLWVISTVRHAFTLPAGPSPVGRASGRAGRPAVHRERLAHR
jgi:hypothetical protein